MTYKPPNVEEVYSDTPESQKRKRDEKYPELEPVTPQQDFETENQQPPSKAPKPDETPAEEDEIDAEDEEEEEDLGEEYEEGDGEEADNDELDEEVNEGEEGEEEGIEEEDVEEEGDEEQDKDTAETRPRVQKAIDKLGRAPLDGTKIAKKPLTASADTLLAMVIDAMLKSRPISHDLTERAISKVIDAGYHDIHKLEGSSWEERTMVLKDGGYNRYREQGATNLGELAELVGGKYGTYSLSPMYP
jgi:hypothetical protein